MLNTKFSPWPSYTAEEADAVKNVLLSNKVNYWTGTECIEFEKEFAQFADTNYAIALSNGSVALELALIALDLGVGDEVIVTPRTFLASASCIFNIGATPVYADVDVDSQNITAATIKEQITTKTKAIICVHLAGWPCEMDSIMDLAREHDLYVIEDCAQAHGAKYNNQSVGSFGDIGVWSFCQDKIITTAGEGGMVTTDNKQLWERMWSYKDHGKSWKSVYETDHPPGYRWLHDSFGTNFRMIEIQGALGRLQLRKMTQWHAIRNQHAAKISQICEQFSCFRVPKIPINIAHAFYKLYVFVKPDQLNNGWDRDRIMDEINQLDVPCYSGSCSEIYLEKAFDNTDLRPDKRLAVAQELGETSLMFLVHPTLSKEEVDTFCQAINDIALQASKK